MAQFVTGPGAVFFLGWQTWEQLSFCLACSIVLVFTGALVVRVRNRMRVKKLCKQATAERGEMGEVVRNSEDVPFGVRALEQGCEVEGVWNSRTATPLHSPIGGSRNSSPSRSSTKLQKSRRGSSISSLPSLGLPEAAHLREPSSVSCNLPPNTRNPSDPVTRYSKPRGSLLSESSVEHDVRFSTESKRKVSHTISYEMPGNFPPDHLETIVSPPFPVYGANTPSQINHDPLATPLTAKKRVRRRTIVIGGVCHTPYPTPQHSPSTKSAKALESMQAHRKFHAAEMGQLLPRTRRRNSGDTNNSLTPSNSASSNEGSGARAISWPAAVEVQQSNTSSKRSAAPLDSLAVPFSTFVQTHPPPKPCPSAWTDKTQDLMEEKLERAKLQTSKPTQAPAIKPVPLTSDMLSHHNKTTRKVNDGFEVLPVGTVDKPPPVKEFGLWPEAPNKRSQDRKRPNKLQKRNRSQSPGRRSARSSGSSGEDVRSYKENVSTEA